MRSGFEVGQPGERLPLVASIGKPVAPAETNRKTALVIGTGTRACALARAASGVGFGCTEPEEPRHALARLEKTARLDLLCLDARGFEAAALLDCGMAADLLDHVRRMQARLVVITDLAGIDPLLAALDEGDTEFLCEPEDADIAALLVLATTRATQPRRGGFCDSTGQSEKMRLEELSEEVRRLTATIERLTGRHRAASEEGSPDRFAGLRTARTVPSMPAHFPAGGAPGRSTQTPDETSPSHAELRALVRARRMRDQFLPADLFGEPAWDMILDLMAARTAGQRVSVSSLCIAAAVPPTTALRWIRHLTDRGIFIRIDDPMDRRRVFIELSESAAEAVSAWALSVRKKGGLLAPGFH
ncbi:MarR family transcriptional regulator [Sphingobium lignivorans]|uniref:DNA-binding MarR family transcriptional regulator/ActR/RegA family two-component response regulator n=1 Tax=Sphingobium lignivorans TaxID=2735886 RepID=A0ABR6NMS1_9SPHN|nr:MarR family transcriptional regulator [Sphingobium lignivorans]MBB5987788.1 DNA-binding MarR family transcriptional regulator/ActR/RegA family two-component response regulator [Sphingobium lignivorans]